MNNVAFQIVRIVAVMALVCVAAALATPKGRLPLALRGLAKMLNAAQPPSRRDGDGAVAPAKRLLAFVLVLLAILLALA